MKVKIKHTNLNRLSLVVMGGGAFKEIPYRNSEYLEDFFKKYEPCKLIPMELIPLDHNYGYYNATHC